MTDAGAERTPSGASTCWTVVLGAAAGQAADREAFAARYVPAARAYLGARWRGGPLAQEIDDALQEVFVEIFRPGGALERVEPGRGGGFRAFFFGLVRNVARRWEARGGRRREGQAASGVLSAHPDDDPRLSAVFDRAWARAVMREAAARQQEAAERSGDAAARRRVEILRARFGEGLPIREIAARWDDDPVLVHRQYARARAEFRRALEAVIRAHEPGPDDELARECDRLLEALGATDP